MKKRIAATDLNHKSNKKWEHAIYEAFKTKIAAVEPRFSMHKPGLNFRSLPYSIRLVIPGIWPWFRHFRQWPSLLYYTRQHQQTR